MSKCFAVNENNDLYIGRDGSLAINQDLASVGQAAAHAAKAQLGEMILAIEDGVANFETIWDSATNVAQFEAYLRREILRVAGVIEIVELSILVQNGVANYTATIATIYGEAALRG